VRTNYSLASPSNGATGYEVNLDSLLQCGIRQLPPEIYEQCLKLLTEMLKTEANKSLVHALTVLLVSNPEGQWDIFLQSLTEHFQGTFKIAQSALSHSLTMLNDICITGHIVDIHLQREVLYYMCHLCSEKVAPHFLGTNDF